jgi:SAM-dependent methyltransferase
MERIVAPLGLKRGEIYQALFAVEPNYLEFALSCFGSARRILEPGCGSGRLSIPIVKSGRSVIGVDSDPEMLAFAQDHARTEGLESHCTFVHADISRNAPAVSAEFAFFSSNLLTLLRSNSAREAALRWAAGCVSRGRIMVILDNAERLLSRGRTRENRRSGRLPNGIQINVHERRRFEEDLRAWIGVDDWTFEAPDGRVFVVSTPVEHAFLARADIENLAWRCGLTIHERFGDYDSRPLDETSRKAIFLMSA